MEKKESDGEEPGREGEEMRERGGGRERKRYGEDDRDRDKERETGREQCGKRESGVLYASASPRDRQKCRIPCSG